MPLGKPSLKRGDYALDREVFMLACATPTEVRRLVGEYFVRLQIDVADDALIETLVIRDGRYYGRSYRAGGVMAMWMIDIGLIQFYAADGEMLATLTLLEEAEGRQTAGSKKKAA